MTIAYKKIRTVVVGSGGASTIDFENIPQIYSDLLIKCSGDSTESDNATSFRVRFNGDSGNISVKELRAIGTTIATYTITAYSQAGYLAASQSTASSFGIADVYIPNYRGSNNKISCADVVLSSNTTSENYAVLSARLWSSSAPITKITLAPSIGSWTQYTTATLYGIRG